MTPLAEIDHLGILPHSATLAGLGNATQLTGALCMAPCRLVGERFGMGHPLITAVVRVLPLTYIHTYI